MLEIISSDFLKATNYLIDNYPTDKRLIVEKVTRIDQRLSNRKGASADE